MADPSYVSLIVAGSTLGGIVAGFLVKTVRRNNNSEKPLTEKDHALICRANLAELTKELAGEFQKHVSKEVGKLYDAIKEVSK